MQYRGFYINLDQNVERRTHVEKQLSAYTLTSRYTRFPACLGNALNLKAPKLSSGAIGCFSSHYQLLKSQISSPTHLHVVEDDIVFSPAIASLLDSLLAQGVMDDCDMLYTDILIPIDLGHLRDLSLRFRQSTILNEDGGVKSISNFSVLALKDRIFACTSSFLVNKNSIAKIASILDEAVQTEITLPIDLYFRQKTREGRIISGCLFPFLTTVSMPLSRVSDVKLSSPQNLDTSICATTLLRNLFFVHSKPRELLASSEILLGLAPMDDRDKIIANICRFGLSHNFESF